MKGRQLRFANGVLIDGNATRAYKAAGYKPKNDVIAAAAASRLLASAKVAAYIAARRQRIEAKTDVTIERVVRELAAIAFIDPRQAYDEHGRLKPIQDWPEDLSRAVSGFDKEELWGAGEDGEGRAVIGDLRKVRFWDKGGALDKLMRHLGGYAPEKHEHTILGRATRLKAARERSKGGGR